MIKLVDFFEDLVKEKIASLFEGSYPWEALKALKTFLNDIVPSLPKEVPLNLPLPETLLLTEEGEVLSFKELEKGEDGFYFKGEKVEGALLMAGAFLSSEKIYFEKGVKVEPFAIIQGPAYFSQGTEVRQGAYVRGSVYTGVGCVIGHTTEVKNSIFLSQAKAAHFAYVGDSILGAQVNLGAGTKLANLKFNKKEIIFTIEGEVIKTGLKKLGAILGDGCQTGCNSVLQPGTILGKFSFVFPARVAGPGFFGPFTKIK
ncbi:glucose-1-phosphate thymidylyltransferase [Thermodesulfobacterium sp. TA1]|uniref:glucose-1-phosphate thymidylyltransferase n=1 Tax=Thermodesulfobacterium sp. TA1 TaxID=2234087 RepID=UPI00123217AF|nr:glucose-1-phosphate thymidylyltransferase [Thermodesulfobacterium sp. TA1]QER42789.1 glucose-1-phosphate thymidylyltransferase [Thermodesulfobacterium sp. TA1]